MKATGKLAAVASATLLAAAAVAAPSVEVTNVQQQYPWTNTVDITYTVAGVKDFPAKTATGAYASNETYFVTFEAKNGKDAIKDVAGNTVFTNALVEGNGTHVAQWHPALGQQVTGGTLTPSVFRGEEDAYMIVNLETNALGKFDVSYEPMSTQEASNERYNTSEYKTRKMVFRRIYAKNYYIGYANTTTGHNPRHQVSIPQDYWVAIFDMTAAQWDRIMGTSQSTSTYPKTGVTYVTLRGSALPAVVPTQGVFAELNAKTGMPGFDLPTETMYEIAQRGGSDDYYMGGSVNNAYAYVWGSENAKGVIPRPVGALRPNGWGFYDMCGNLWKVVRDHWDARSLAVTQPDGLVPVSTGGVNAAVPYKAASPTNRGVALCATLSFVEPDSKTYGSGSNRVGIRVSYFPQRVPVQGN